MAVDHTEEQRLQIMSMKSLMTDQVNQMKTMLTTVDDRDTRFANLTRVVENNHDDANALMNALNGKITDKTLKIESAIQNI